MIRHRITRDSNQAAICDPSEFAIQAAFVEWVRLMQSQHPQLQTGYAVPNGSHKSPAARVKHQREGLLSGIPDFHFPYPTAKHPGLYLEFKTRKGVVSINQKRMIDLLRLAGHRVEIVRSTEEAIAVTKEHYGIR